MKSPIRLACDASKGWGASVSHSPFRGRAPSASKTFTTTERSYAHEEREVAAVLFGVTHLNKFLWGREFELVTDHSSLVKIFGSKASAKPLAVARFRRGAILLHGYRFKIGYKKGISIPHADVLSRLPLADGTPLKSRDNVICFVVT